MPTTEADIIARRRATLGPTYKLFFDEPLHIVSAKGVWMRGADGRDYLDVYNNVPVVGHCHPHVVETLYKQASTLNTHTRYLTDPPVQLAERLLATMPPEVDNVVFVCSGSEANELAIRVCKFATGGTGVIVTEAAYHGTTEMLAGMSPASGIPLGRHVYTVPAPSRSKDAPDFAAGVRDAIARMRADGVKPAALLVDTFFSSDGSFPDPAGFLAAAAEEIRKAGGLFIADEVQPGFGRTGDGMWGFARHGIVPDCVTMGKPMGNGHPIAAMAARGDLMARFARQAGYFNTFGGNTVSCAVGMAVLDVIEKEGLIANARTVGEHMRKGLEELATKHKAMAAVRGRGLYCAVDIRDGSSEQSRASANTVVNGLKQEGVLIGATGPNKDVLKIRPPLPFTTENSTFFLKALDKVLSR